MLGAADTMQPHPVGKGAISLLELNCDYDDLAELLINAFYSSYEMQKLPAINTSFVNNYFGFQVFKWSVIFSVAHYICESVGNKFFQCHK